jgi:hypothetical protein
MKRVKEGHRLEKPEHCDREYTFIKALSKLLFMRESDRTLVMSYLFRPFSGGLQVDVYTRLA